MQFMRSRRSRGVVPIVIATIRALLCRQEEFTVVELNRDRACAHANAYLTLVSKMTIKAIRVNNSRVRRKLTSEGPGGGTDRDGAIPVRTIVIGQGFASPPFLGHIQSRRVYRSCVLLKIAEAAMNLTKKMHEWVRCNGPKNVRLD